MAICIIATVTPKPEFRDSVEQAMRTLVSHTRKEPGNLRYDLFARVDGADAFDVFEIYTDQAAIDAHSQSPHFQAFSSQVKDLLSAPVEVRLSQPVDVAPF
jgi:quinol monooxygenase YgiN